MLPVLSLASCGHLMVDRSRHDIKGPFKLFNWSCSCCNRAERTGSATPSQLCVKRWELELAK